MSRLVLNSRNFKFIVIGAHILLVVMLFMIFGKFDPVADKILALAPVQDLYNNQGIGWVGTWREVSHMILTIFDGTVGFLLIKYGLLRKHEVQKYFAVAIGSQLMFSSALSVSLLGLVIWGGLWHFISAVVAMAMAGSAFISFSLLLIYWGSLMALAANQDAAFQETKDHL